MVHIQALFMLSFIADMRKRKAVLNSHLFSGKAGEVSMWYGGGSHINVRLCGQGGSKLLSRMMQNGLERDNESCWSKTVESMDNGMDCKPLEQDYN